MYQVRRVYVNGPRYEFYVLNTATKQVQSAWSTLAQANQARSRLNAAA